VCLSFFQVLKIAPNDKDAKEQYERCRKEYNEFKSQQQRSKEIKENSVFRSIHPEKMGNYPVDSAYDESESESEREREYLEISV
jgi:hypothetical protein